VLKAQQYGARKAFALWSTLIWKTLFDRVNHDILMERLSMRVSDKAVLRLIRSYLKAGIMSGGVVMARDEGTPQGGPIAPLTQKVISNSRAGTAWPLATAYCAGSMQQLQTAEPCSFWIDGPFAINVLPLKTHVKHESNCSPTPHYLSRSSKLPFV